MGIVTIPSNVHGMHKQGSLQTYQSGGNFNGFKII